MTFSSDNRELIDSFARGTEPPSVVEPDDETRRQILEAEALRQRALLEVDLKTLDSLYDEALVHIHAPGVTHTKAQLLEHVATRQAYLDMSRGELTIRLVGDVAIMTGRLTNRLGSEDGSERVVDGMVTQVLRRCEDGRWRFVSFQMTPDGTQAWGSLPSEEPTVGEEPA
jgi:ketosteroid isomerase-like protein